MKCENCHEREATMHITTGKGFSKKEQFLCEQCADESFSTQYSSFSDDSFNIHQLLKSLAHHKNITEQEQSAERCDTCGSTIETILQNGKFGCSECYESFGDKVQEIVTRVQHHQHAHVGKVPTRSAEHLKVKRQLDGLKHKLNELVDEQEFEEAAVVRDEIKAIETAGDHND